MLSQKIPQGRVAFQLYPGTPSNKQRTGKMAAAHPLVSIGALAEFTCLILAMILSFGGVQYIDGNTEA